MNLRQLVALSVLAVAVSAGPSALLAQTDEQRLVRINGADLYVELHGAGPPLLLLHAFGQSSLTWRPFVAQLATEYRVIVPDLRGHGRSTNPSGAFTHREAADDIYALLDTLGVREFSAMGISSGGMTLLHMATQSPARVHAMVLIDATPRFPEQARAILRSATPETITPEQWATQRSFHPRGDQQILALRAAFRAMGDDTTDMAFTRASLATIRARTLIVHGDRDRFFPAEMAMELYRGIPVSQLWIVPNGGHADFLRDPVLAFIAAATRFLHGS